MKNALTPAGIEPAPFRFVAQHLNRCATAVPPPHEAQHGTKLRYHKTVTTAGTFTLIHSLHRPY